MKIGNGQLQDLHNKANLELKKVSDPKIEKIGIISCSKIVAKHLNVSSQTIVNYILGTGKDGFLTQLIIAEFKKL
jgi:hypothetical protein